MNTHIIVGVLLVALGTGVMIYGQWTKSKADSTALETKVDGVLQRIDSIRSGTTDPTKEAELAQVEDDFTQWATDFLRNREQKRIALQRSGLASVEEELRVSAQWRPIYQYVLDTVTNLARAYSAATNEPVVVSLPPLPDNFYGTRISDYGGKVAFPNKIVWHVGFRSDERARADQGPNMLIFIGTDDFVQSLDSRVQLYPLRDKLIITCAGERVPLIEGVESEIPVSAYHEPLKAALQRLFEAQLLVNQAGRLTSR
jgi:hypothetical protein